MRVVRRVVPAALAGMLMTLSRLHAQGAEFSLGGGIGVPLGTYDDVVKMGWQGTAGVSFVPHTSPFAIQIDGNYAQFSDETALDIKSQLIYGTANAVYRFQSSENTRFRPYLIGGGGVYNSKATGSDAPDGSTTKFGINLGAGFDFKAGGAGLFLEARWHDVFLSGNDLKFLPITLGIRFGGS
jgi:opacity protein-like surface antigen